MEKKNPGKKSERVYFFKKGKKVMNEYEFAKAQGILTVPTHNAELLKLHLIAEFEKVYSKVQEEWRLNGIEPKAKEILLCRMAHLQKEFTRIKNWNDKADLPHHIELKKYATEIENEANRIEQVLKLEKQYTTFRELYDDALHFGLISLPLKQEDHRRQRNPEAQFGGMKQGFSVYVFNKFQTRLTEWSSPQFFTRENFIDYLKSKQDAKSKEAKAFEVEKAKWIIANEETGLNPLPPQQTKIKEEQETIEKKPVLKPAFVPIVFDIIKDFFSDEHQAELKLILNTGDNASKKLLFKDNSNRLTDTFKKLIEHDFITGCEKKDLINWIISNFTFTQQNKVKSFIYDTVEKTISRNYYPCKSPLIEINNGQIQKVEQPRTKKYSKQ